MIETDEVSEQVWQENAEHDLRPYRSAGNLLSNNYVILEETPTEREKLDASEELRSRQKERRCREAQAEGRTQKIVKTRALHRRIPIKDEEHRRIATKNR